MLRTTDRAPGSMSLRLPALLFIAMCAGAHGATDVDELVGALDSVRRAHDIAAVGFALVADDRVIHADALGLADRASARAADAHTRFRIGSITKAFTGLALAHAAESGLVSLDAPLRDIAGPELVENPWAACAPVTVAMLLEHTAGLTDLTREEMYHSDPAPLPLRDAVRKFASNRVVRWHPGRFYSYSNAGPGLAAHALERAAAIDFDTYLRATLFEPLGLRATTLRLNQATRAHLATGYDRDGHTVIPYWHMLFRPFGAINSTPADMARFLRMLLAGGRLDGRRIVSETVLARAMHPRTSLAARNGLVHGYGLGLYAWEHDGVTFHGHGGDGDGYLAHLGFAPTANAGYFIVINAFRHAPLRQMRNLIENFIVARSPPLSSAPPATRGPVATLPAAVVGDYYPAAFRFAAPVATAGAALSITLDGDGLAVTRENGAVRRLLPVTSALWRYADERLPGVVITESGEDVLFLERRAAYRRGVRIAAASPAGPCH